MRIALSVHHYLDWNSGASGSVMALSKALQDHGHRVELLSFDNLPNWTSRLPPSIGVRLRPLIFPWYLARWMRRRLMEFDVVDLLSGDGWLLYSLAQVRRSAIDRPLFVTRGAGLEHVILEALSGDIGGLRLARGLKSFCGSLYDLFYSRHLRLWEVERSYELADVCLFLNDFDRVYAIERFPLPAERVRLTRNGLPDSLLALKSPRRMSGDRLIIAQIGSYVELKGIHYGAKALSDVMARYSHVHVRFLGTSCDREQVLHHFAPELRDRIEVVPAFERDALPRLLADCEIKLYPTLAEGFGKALLEAMACGLAPVSTTTPGPMSIVEPEVDGLLVPPRDSLALAEALGRLIADADLRFRFRTNAHRKAQGFSWEEVTRQRVQIYREFLDRKPAPRVRRLPESASADGP